MLAKPPRCDDWLRILDLSLSLPQPLYGHASVDVMFGLCACGSSEEYLKYYKDFRAYQVRTGDFDSFWNPTERATMLRKIQGLVPSRESMHIAATFLFVLILFCLPPFSLALPLHSREGGSRRQRRDEGHGRAHETDDRQRQEEGSKAASSSACCCRGKQLRASPRTQPGARPASSPSSQIGLHEPRVASLLAMYVNINYGFLPSSHLGTACIYSALRGLDRPPRLLPFASCFPSFHRFPGKMSSSYDPWPAYAAQSSTSFPRARTSSVSRAAATRLPLSSSDGDSERGPVHVSGLAHSDVLSLILLSTERRRSSFLRQLWLLSALGCWEAASTLGGRTRSNDLVL